MIDGVLNIRTVSDSRNAAAVNAMFVRGIIVQGRCRDTDCDCMVRALARLCPDVRLVAVTVGVAQ